MGSNVKQIKTRDRVKMIDLSIQTNETAQCSNRVLREGMT